MTQEEIQFLEANIVNFETAKIGFVRNLPKSILQQYEVIYQKYVDSKFILTYWCGSCALEMIQRLYPIYEGAMILQSISKESALDKLPEPSITIESVPEPVETKKKTKRKR